MTCDDSGCNEDCVSEAHIVCDCPRDQRLPAMELLFIKDQVDKVGRGKMFIASVDVKETTRFLMIQKYMMIITKRVIKT